KNFEDNMGDNVRAMSEEKATAAAIVIANSENKRPMSPCRKTMGTKIAINTSVVAITANPTSRVASNAVNNGGFFFSSMCRTMFSSTTFASSTTRPMASTNASRVSILSEKSKAASTVKVATMDTGTAIACNNISLRDRKSTLLDSSHA